MAMLVLDLKPGDEVIMPSFTFVSAANAVVLRGGQPVYADIQADTLNLDPADVEIRITARTRAIMPVHYAGVACDMDAFMDIAGRHGLAVIEDAAQGVDAYHRGRPLGTIGDMGCYSFHDTKNITCGEGGAFLTNRDDLATKAEMIREKGTNRTAFLRGEMDKYTWVSLGSSYIQSDLLAALLEAQLERRAEIKTKRKIVWEAYYHALLPFEEEGKIILQKIPQYAEPNYHLFFFRVPSRDDRDRVLLALKQIGLQATFHYIPLHSSPFSKQHHEHQYQLPRTDEYSLTLIRLPLYPQLESRIAEISEGVKTVIAMSL
jgi:dTDP-4-amino-4,6-dideoxygalactose transaminase